MKHDEADLDVMQVRPIADGFMLGLRNGYSHFYRREHLGHVSIASDDYAVIRVGDHLKDVYHMPALAALAVIEGKRWDRPAEAPYLVIGARP